MDLFNSTSDEGFLDNLKQLDLAGLSGNVWQGARDEFLGIDDFRRALEAVRERDLFRALKSLGAGTLELGSSAALLVHGGQAALAAKLPKVGKLGRLGRLLEVTAPMNLGEQALARGASRAGIKRSWRQGPPLGPYMNDIAEAAGGQSALALQAPIRQFGRGRGGIAGSIARAPLQYFGVTPVGAGPLASAQGFRGLRAPRLSGTLGMPFARAERDEMMQYIPGVGSPAPAVDPEIAAMLEMLGYSPVAAY
jgi:hypothetical protein